MSQVSSTSTSATIIGFAPAAHVRRLDPARLEDRRALRQVWDWIQARRDWFPETGGRQTWEEYLADAHRFNQADFAVELDGQLVSVITVDTATPGHYQFHLASCPQPPVEELIDAVYTLGYGLFEQANAQEIFTFIPSFHRGSRRVALACGLRPDGNEEVKAEFRGRPIRWIRYQMSRLDFYQEHYRNEQQ
jgi:hypothetical protein